MFKWLREKINPTPIAGELYIDKVEKDNPFVHDHSLSKYRTVIDVKNGWVRFCYGKSSINYTCDHSRTISSFNTAFVKVEDD